MADIVCSHRPPLTEAAARDFVARSAALLAIPLAPEHLPTVTANFLRLAGMADVLAEFAGEPTLEAAPIFEP